MKALVDYESCEQSEHGDSTSESPAEGPKQPEFVPDVDKIIRETRAQLEQARLKADRLICQFAEAYVDAAGRLRDTSIQRYRERLEGLPAEACAKVCETLAKDDIFCCNMDFGNGHLSSGGMSFTYKIQSDAAFNALSHHAWKDLYQSFIKDQSPPLLGNGLEQGQPYVVDLAHYDDEEDGLEAPQDRSPSLSGESDSSSGEEDFPSPGDSDGDFGGMHDERHRSSASPSPEWTTEDEIKSSGTPKRRGVGRPSKHQSDSDAPEKRGPGRPTNKSWSAEEEVLMRRKMEMQLQRRGDLILTKKACLNLMKDFPGRTRFAVKNRWLDLKSRDTQDDLKGREGQVEAVGAKAKVRVRNQEVKKHHDKDSGSSPQLQLSDDSGNSEAVDELRSRDRSFPSKAFHVWSAQEVEALVRLTKGSNSSRDIDFKAVADRLPSLIRRTEKACKVYWQTHLQSLLKRDQDQDPTPESKVPDQGADISSEFDIVKRSDKGENRGPEPSRGLASHKQRSKTKSSSRAKHRQSKTADKRNGNLWTCDEDDLLWRLALTGIPWPDVAAQIPGRTAPACQSRYTDRLINVPEYQERLNGQPGRLIRGRVDPKPDPEPVQESPEEADTAIGGGGGSKHERESDDESEKRSAVRRKKHRGALQQSSLRGRDRDGGSEAEEADESMYEFE